jgi:hypothetical protein
MAVVWLLSLYHSSLRFAGRDNPLISIRRPANAGMNQAPRSLSYNPAENAVLLTSDVDGGSYELYNIPKDARGDAAPVGHLFLLLLSMLCGCCLQLQVTARAWPQGGIGCK